MALLHAINQDLKPIPFRISDARYWAMVESMQELFRPDAERAIFENKVGAPTPVGPNGEEAIRIISAREANPGERRVFLEQTTD